MATDSLIDTLFDGRYRIVRKLGAGGMANVYLAEDQDLGRRVAIKILNDRHANDDQFVERFRREAKNAASLSHPNIVSVYDRGEYDGAYYIAMEYIEGRTLKELIVTRGPSPVAIAIDYSRQILSALRFAHRNGIVHRDIKPHNVIVDSEGRVKVTDFGIARAGTSQMTEAGSIIGTAQYLSPEQARGAPVDQTSDLYSAGIVLYELLTGTVPFSGDTPVEIAMKHLSQTPEPPSAVAPGSKGPEIPRDLDYVVLRALAKDPAERYRSAEEMDGDLERIARGIAVSAETAEAATTVLAGAAYDPAPTAVTTIRPGPTTPRYQTGRYYAYDEPAPRRRAVWPWLLALGLVILVGIGGWFAYQSVQDQLASAKPVAVPDVGGLQESNAVQQLLDKGLEPKVRRVSSSDAEIGKVFDQDPEAGNRIDRGNFVTILVSNGKPKVRVPDVVGMSLAEAVAALSERNLKANPVRVNSEQEPDTVTAQAPKPGETLIEDATVRINVSKGPKPVQVPNVVGLPYESAASTLQGANFAVARVEVDSDQPKGTVVDQSPNGNELTSKGSTIRLQVSKGPTTEAIPDVTSQSTDSARETLITSGFKVKLVQQDTDDPSLEGLVISQDPPGGEQGKPGTTVTIFVGRFTGTPPTTPTDTTTITTP